MASFNNFETSIYTINITNAYITKTKILPTNFLEIFVFFTIYSTNLSNTIAVIIATINGQKKIPNINDNIIAIDIDIIHNILIPVFYNLS